MLEKLVLLPSLFNRINLDKQHSNLADLEHKPIPALIGKYFWPAFTGVIINSLYNIVDRIFIGQSVGALALSGITAVFPIMLIIMAFGMMIGMGAGVRISINLGEKNLKRAELVLGNAFILMIIVGILISAVGFGIRIPVLKLFGVGESTTNYAIEYLNIILFAAPLNMIGFSLNNLIRSEGNARIAMVSMIISASTNIILDYVFIYILDMGVAGAAYATMISQFILCVWVIIHFRSHRSVIKLRFKNFRLERKIFFYIISIGFAPFLMQFAASAVQGLYNFQLTSYGNDYAIGAMGVIISVLNFLVMSVIALNMAAQPILGYNTGAKRYYKVKETLIFTLIAGTAISVFGFILTESFPETLVRMFSNDEKLIQIGVRGIKIFSLTFPIIGFQIVMSNYFQSTGKAGKAALISLLRQVIVLIPILTILPKYYGIDGVWASSPISDIISGLIVLGFLIVEFKNINAKIKKFNPEH